MSSREGGQVDDQGAFLLNPKIVSDDEKAELKKQAECVPPWIPLDPFTPRLGDGPRLSPRNLPARCSHPTSRTRLILLPVRADADALFQEQENLAMAVDTDALGMDLFLPPHLLRLRDSPHRDLSSVQKGGGRTFRIQDPIDLRGHTHLLFCTRFISNSPRSLPFWDSESCKVCTREQTGSTRGDQPHGYWQSPAWQRGTLSGSGCRHGSPPNRDQRARRSSTSGSSYPHYPPSVDPRLRTVSPLLLPFDEGGCNVKGDQVDPVFPDLPGGLRHLGHRL